MAVGVLALQGATTPHLHHFRKLGAECLEVRSSAELAKTDRLVIPGGESTCMLKLMEAHGLSAVIKEYAANHALWGVCAGAILIASQVRNPAQACLRLIDIRATRNFYGSQRESFKASLSLRSISVDTECSVECDFIRAPLLEPLSGDVEVLAKYQDSAVLLRQNRVLASSFHTELGDDSRLHQYFLKL